MFLLLSLLLVPIARASDWNNQYCSENNEEEHDALCLIQSRTKIVKPSMAAHARNLHIIPPASRNYNLDEHSVKKPYASEWGQDRLLEPLFNGKKDGFFVEAGAMDGEGASNTLFFEMQGWSGLLVEPNPYAFDQIQKKNRKAFSYHGCLSNSRDIEDSTFFDGGWMGMDHQGDAVYKKDQPYNVTCAPLQNLLGSIHPGFHRHTVDLWSLDIEGAEPAVLENTDFHQVEVGVLIIEWQADAPSKDKDYKRMQAVLDREGFQYVGSSYYSGGFRNPRNRTTPCNQWVQLDRVFVNPKYFEARDLKVPTELPKNPLCPSIL